MSCRSNYCFVNRNGLILNILTFLIPETMTLRSLLRSALTLLAITSTLIGTFATTIIPFPNLGEMAKAADAVVMAKVEDIGFSKEQGIIRRQIHFTIKVDLKNQFVQGEQFYLNSWWHKNGDQEIMIWGDPEFVRDRTYLIFLTKIENSSFWQTSLMAYGVFDEQILNGTSYLVPNKESEGIQPLERPDGVPVEPLITYETDKLLSHLTYVIQGKTQWNSKIIEGQNLIEELTATFRTAPVHCRYFMDGSNNRVRYQGFPGDDIVLRSEDNGDNYEANVHLLVQNAITTMIGSYPGISLTYGGMQNYDPNCLGGYGAYGGNFTANVGPREALVIYNDPCNQVLSLGNCTMVLAIGGLYFGGSHSFDGDTWSTGDRSFVIVNDSAGACLSAADYTTMLIHELTHGLGFDHIPDVYGNNNMKAICCNNITNLDIECLNYTYPPLPLPIEWQSFSAVPGPKGVQLEWTTASEWNSAWFYVERSQDGKQFQLIDRLPAAGNSTALQTYVATDPLPVEGSNYYRIKQEDYDGSYSYSPVQEVTIATQAISFQQIAASAAEGILFQVGSPAHQWVTFRCYNSAGIFIYTEKRELQKGVQQFTFSQPLPTDGIYVVQAIFNDQTLVLTVPSF